MTAPEPPSGPRAQKIQRCYVCDAPTGRCEEDSIYLPPKDPNGSDLGPLCEACCDDYLDPTRGAGLMREGE